MIQNGHEKPLKSHRGESAKESPFPRYCFSKADRLLKRADYVSLSKAGESVSDRYFIVAYRPNAFGKTRLGITVTRKVGNAVTRNRIKRVVREHFRLNRLQIRGELDINIIAKRAAADVQTQKAFQSLNMLLNRIGGPENQIRAADPH